MAWRSAATAGRIAILPTTSCLFEEAADEIAGGAGGDLGRRRELLHLAVVEERNAIGEREGFLVIVGDEDLSEAKLVVDLAQGDAKLAPDLGVERAERLVEQQDARVAGKRTGERDALPLSARQLIWIALAEAGQLDEAEQLLDPVAGRRARRALRPLHHVQAKGDVLRDGHMAKQRILLEHKADPARRRLVPGHVALAEPHLAF